MKNKEEKTKGMMLLCCLPVLLCLAGCGNWSFFGPSAVEQDYGGAVRNEVAQSVLNPRAGQTEAVAPGLSGTASVINLERYDKSFKGEEKKPTELKIQ